MEKTNKLIAEFMGWGEKNDFLFPPNDESMHTIDGWNAEDIPYHKSWDWIIPVIDKIDDKILDNPKLDCSEKMKDITIKNDFMDIRYKFANIEEVYYTVVEFIKDYNQNN